MKKIIAGMLAAMVLAAAGVAGAAQVPPLINFQSVLYDDAGEPIPDGSSSVNFRITDINGSVLYEENQTLDVVHGMVSAMVGNGQTSNGSPTGGIPLDVFETDAGRYLEVTVDDYQPQATMEIVSVPYALYADKAMGAVDGSIGGDAIKDGAITAKHFSDEALKELGGAMVNSDSLSVPSAAQSIGVRSGFSYSGSSNIQGVLTDLDRVMATRNSQMDSKVADLQQRISDEVGARASGDGNLQTQINDATTRITNVEGTVNDHGQRISDVEGACPASPSTSDRFGGLNIVAYGSIQGNNDIRGPELNLDEADSSATRIYFDKPRPDADYLVQMACDLCIPVLGTKTDSYFDITKWGTGGGGAISTGYVDFIVFDDQVQ